MQYKENEKEIVFYLDDDSDQTKPVAVSKLNNNPDFRYNLKADCDYSLLDQSKLIDIFDTIKHSLDIDKENFGFELGLCVVQNESVVINQFTKEISLIRESKFRSFDCLYSCYLPNISKFERLSIFNNIKVYSDNVKANTLYLSSKVKTRFPLEFEIIGKIQAECVIYDLNIPENITAKSISANPTAKSVSNTTGATFLDLSGSDIKNLPEFKEELEVLDISNTNIRKLPVNLKVDKLDITNTKVTKIPKSIILKKLIASKSKLKYLHVSDIEYCNISNTEVVNLPENFKSQFLNICDTPISEIPKSADIKNIKLKKDQLHLIAGIEHKIEKVMLYGQK